MPASFTRFDYLPAPSLPLQPIDLQPQDAVTAVPGHCRSNVATHAKAAPDTAAHALATTAAGTSITEDLASFLPPRPQPLRLSPLHHALDWAAAAPTTPIATA